MDRTGWNAVIYDADWARFKSGQKGITVYGDGKKCETITESQDNVIIEADPNDSFIADKVGHILFKQKGTDNISIVCFKIEAGIVSYKLVADNGNLSLILCPNITSSDEVIEYALLNAGLSLVGNDGTKKGYEEIKDNLTVTDFKPDFIAGFETTYTIIVKYTGDIANGVATTITVKTVDPKNQIDNENSEICASVKSCNLASAIISTKSNTTIDCIGGTVQYSLERKYNIEIDPNGSKYHYTKCGNPISDVDDVTELYLSGTTEGLVYTKTGKNKMTVTVTGYNTNGIDITASLPKVPDKTKPIHINI